MRQCWLVFEVCTISPTVLSSDGELADRTELSQQPPPISWPRTITVHHQLTMTSPVIPLHWILEYAVTDPSKFKDSFILGGLSSNTLLTIALCDQLASTPDQPQIPPTVLIALLHRIFSHPNSKDICDVDHGILETIDYLELLETQRLKRMKALEKRGGTLVSDLLKTSAITLSRYNFSLICIKYWVRDILGDSWW